MPAPVFVRVQAGSATAAARPGLRSGLAVTGRKVLVLRTPVGMAINPLAAVVEPAVDAVALTVEPGIDTVALLVQARIDTVALAIQFFGQFIITARGGCRGTAIEFRIDSVAFMVEVGVNPVALAIEPFLDPVALPVQPLLHSTNIDVSQAVTADQQTRCGKGGHFPVSVHYVSPARIPNTRVFSFPGSINGYRMKPLTSRSGGGICVMLNRLSLRGVYDR
jgi:hypothetical protein